MRHTPGPWRISEFERRAGGTDRVVMGADNFGVAWIMGRTVEEHENDARLIAAAPELLAALQYIVDAFDYNPGHSDLDNEQPIAIHATLGDYRNWSSLLYKAKGL